MFLYELYVQQIASAAQRVYNADVIEEYILQHIYQLDYRTRNSNHSRFAECSKSIWPRVEQVNKKSFYAVKSPRPLESYAYQLNVSGFDIYGLDSDGVRSKPIKKMQNSREEVKDVRKLGAVADGRTDDSALINKLLSYGGTVHFPSGHYYVQSPLIVSQDDTIIEFGSNVIIEAIPWRYNNSQSPFGSIFVVTGRNVKLKGSGIGDTQIRVKGGSEANGITFLHTDGGYVGHMTLDGGSLNATAILDDTFMTGISVLNATGGNAKNQASKVSIEHVEIKNWAQYGLQVYGNLSSVSIKNCWIHHNGILSQSISRGAGVAFTRGVRNTSISECIISNNKQDGIFGSSAGIDSYGIEIKDNIIVENGRWGISWSEEQNLASIKGSGTSNLSIRHNYIEKNGRGDYDATGGLRVGTYDLVGYIKDIYSEMNVIRYNIGYGWLFQSNAAPEAGIYRISIDDCMYENYGQNVAISDYARDGVVIKNIHDCR